MAIGLRAILRGTWQGAAKAKCKMNQLSSLISNTGRIKVGSQGKHAATALHLIPRTRNVTRTRLISYVVLNEDAHLLMDLDPIQPCPEMTFRVLLIDPAHGFAFILVYV
jgi:hypothetical protein